MNIIVCRCRWKSRLKTTHREQDAGRCWEQLVGYTAVRSSEQQDFYLCADIIQTHAKSPLVLGSQAWYCVLWNRNLFNHFSFTTYPLSLDEKHNLVAKLWHFLKENFHQILPEQLFIPSIIIRLCVTIWKKNIFQTLSYLPLAEAWGSFPSIVTSDSQRT